jgi:ABC transport system ATP-binding/permease protein
VHVGSASGALLHRGRRIAIGPEGVVTIGRAADNDLVVAGERVSRHHARIEEREGACWLVNLGSRHGTTVNGTPVRDEARRLQSGDAIEVGGELIRFLAGEETRMASREAAVAETRTVRLTGPRLTLGRDPANDLVLPDPNVSRFHAELIRSDGRAEIVDLGSRNGTRVGGEVVERAELADGAVAGIGPYRLLFDGEGLVARSEVGALRLEATGVAVETRGKQILAPASTTLGPGELVAIIGESGAGKTTLLKVLAGVSRPSTGAVTVNGEPLANRLTDIGYVPQEDIVHRLLDVREALGFAARLRLPEDASPEEIQAAVDRVLTELSLDAHAGTRVVSLSGGQRRRTGVACELLGRPGLLFLDEPTTGMDPGLESKMMALFRELADASRGVALVTHATKNLALCDRVIVMARGGRLVFDGAPQGAPDFFEVDDYDGIYAALDESPGGRWTRPQAAVEGEPRERATEEPAAQQPAPAAAPRRGSMIRQTRVLTARYWKVLARDRRNLALLVGQAPILALAGIGLFHAGIFDLPGGSPAEATQLLFLMVIVVIWLGSLDAAREIVKERSVLERESAVGVRLPAYLLSKLLVLFGLVSVQVLLYTSLLFAFRPLDADLGAWSSVLLLFLVTGYAAVGMGLLISAAAQSEDQSISIVPLAVIPQLLFAGTIVTVERMAEPAQTLSQAAFSQWSLAAIGDAIDLNALIAADPAFAAGSGYGPDFFDLELALGVAVQLGFLAAFVAATAVLLVRRGRA